MAETKRNFYEAFSRPIPGIYSNVIQELLVQQHIMRYNKSYSYDEASQRLHPGIISLNRRKGSMQTIVMLLHITPAIAL